MKDLDFDTDLEQEPQAPEAPVSAPPPQKPTVNESYVAPSPLEMLKEKILSDKKAMMAAGAGALLALFGFSSLFSHTPAPEQPAPQVAEAPASDMPPPPPAPPAAPHADPLAWGAAPAAIPPAPAAAQPQPPSSIPPSTSAAPEPIPPATSAAPEAPQPAPAAAPADDARLSTIEKNIADLKEQMVTKADLESLTVAVGKLQQEAETRANAAEEKKKAETAATPPAAPATTASTTAPAKKMVWILKSAKPGTAWVAEKGSRELRTVSVGDTLPGIGKVTSIDKNAEGLWEVVGEEGRIGQ